MTYPQDININVITKVILTAHGASVINQYNKGYHISGDEDLDEKIFPTNYKEGDTIERALWELMIIFGPHMSQGGPIVFMSNNITLVSAL